MSGWDGFWVGAAIVLAAAYVEPKETVDVGIVSLLSRCIDVQAGAAK